MFFGDAFAGSLLNLFATHPPLAARIRAFEPGFDGRFPAVQPLAAAAEARRAGRHCWLVQQCRGHGWTSQPWHPQSGSVVALDAAAMVGRVGRPQPEHVEHAGGSSPRSRNRCWTPPGSRPLPRRSSSPCLLSRDDEAVRARQLQTLQGAIQPALLEQVRRLAGPATAMAATARLPLADLTVPAMKKASPQQYQQFRQAVETLVNAEHRVDLFEYCLRIVLFCSLDVHFGLKKPPAIRYRSVASVRVRAGKHRPFDACLCRSERGGRRATGVSGRRGGIRRATPACAAAASYAPGV